MSYTLAPRDSDNSSDEGAEIRRKIAALMAQHKDQSKSKSRGRELHMIVQGSSNSHSTANNTKNMQNLVLESHSRELETLKEQLKSERDRSKHLEEVNDLLQKEVGRLNKNNIDLRERIDQQDIKIVEQEKLLKDLIEQVEDIRKKVQ